MHLCRDVVGRVDLRRFKMVVALVNALLAGGRLTLTALGRTLASDAQVKHRIKRVDRFLGSAHAHGERLLYYSLIARRLLGQARRPVILIDWTKVVSNKWALVAGVASRGRAVPIYSEVHDEELLANRHVQYRFMLTLAQLLPADARPVIVADAGFKTPFFLIVDELRWSFVIRLRGNCSLKQDRPRRFLRFARAFAMASREARSLGEWIPYAGGFWSRAYRIVLAARPVKPQRRRQTSFYVRRALEPWLLATNLRGELPRCIVELYAKRMQIEETFRDAKNGRLGWALEHSRSRSEARLEALILIAALALTATLLAGAAAEERGLARSFQANSERRCRVLSLVRLGMYVMQSDTASLGVRRVVAMRLILEVYVQRPFQQTLPFTRLRRGTWC